MNEKMFTGYRSRVVKEGVLKAFIVALLIAFSVVGVTAFVFWAVGVKQVWILAIIFAAVIAIAMPLFYCLKFRPTVKQVAMRIDELGLEERVLTMTELKNEESFIAVKQREDTMRALSTVNAGLIPILVSVPLIVATVATGVVGSGATTLSILGATGVIKSGSAWIEELTTPDPKQFELTYEVEGEGMIDGDIFQVVQEGEDATAVVAVADDEWVFVGWSDGSTSPYRTDKKVGKNITVVAVFMQLNEGEGMEMPGDEEGEGKKQEGKDGKPSDKPGDEENDKPSAGGEYEPTNQVIDGETYYGDEIFESSYESVLEYLAQNDDIPEEVKKFILDYFNTIKQ